MAVLGFTVLHCIKMGLVLDREMAMAVAVLHSLYAYYCISVYIPALGFGQWGDSGRGQWGCTDVCVVISQLLL